MSSIFSTQSLLLAVGVGAKKALPSAAAINWVLKDGLGRLGRLTVATRFGESFDADLKRFRFVSSLMYAGALSLDYLTPLAPSHFLPMATLANVGKSVGLTTYIATQPAFYKSFAKSENIADISAKAQAQQMAVDTLGLAVAMSLNFMLKSNEAARRALPLAMFPILVSGDLFSIYKELRSVELKTLNKERAEFIAQHWASCGVVPSPRQVSASERFILPSAIDLGQYPLKIGTLSDSLRSYGDIERFMKSTKNKMKYVISVSDGPKKGILRASLHKDAKSIDILELILLSQCVRNSDPCPEEAQAMIPALQKRAHSDVKKLISELKKAGWQVEPFTLSSAERKFYK